MTSGPAAVTSHPRGLWLAVIGCAVAAAALILAAGQVWLQVSLPRDPPLPGVSASFTGGQMASRLVPTGILAGAASLALIAGRRVVRLAVGSVLVLTGLLTLGGMWFQIEDEGFLRALSWAQRYQPADSSLESILPDRDFSAAPAWLALAGGGLILAVGLMTILRSKRWPVIGARYDRNSRPAPASSPRPSSTVDAQGGDDGPGAFEERSMWSALERGEDPTLSVGYPPEQGARKPPNQPESSR
ncbi:MAG: Trp biosynthesis-associated membrane protein [Actinomycetota bacterium]|nr:Trp biosynthesis-associated membrane protein [Actinomycetota bacterium]